jgi:hypothetical protein
MTEKTMRRYLLVITLSHKSAKDNDQLGTAESLKRIKGALDRLPKADMQLAFSSRDGKSFGFFLQTHYSARGIVGFLESPDSDRQLFKDFTKMTGSALRDDTVMVVELGRDFCSLNLGTAGTWLQLHQEKSPA